MNLLPKKWTKLIAVGIGVAGIVTLPLLELGWIPEHQASKAVIFLLSFLVLDGAANEARESGTVPEPMTSTEKYFHSLGSLVGRVEHELLSVVHGEDVTREELTMFLSRLFSRVRSEKQLH